MTIRWIPAPALIAAHTDQMKQHGGLHGGCDREKLESALARPVNLLAYNNASLPALAASYGFGLARNHCFPDGNKRISLVAMDIFLQLNGYELAAPEVEVVDVIQRLAAGDFDEPGLTAWVEQNMEAL